MDLSGHRSGDLEFVRPIGQGGMGIVYEARQHHLGRRLAVKVLSHRIARDETLRERFLREARLLARIDHPSVVHCYDAHGIDGPKGELLVLLMEYIDGWTLPEAINRRSLSARHVIELHRQVARGLAAVHAAGVVHRDCKPSNILVDKRGRARLIDFGIAWHAELPSLTGTDIIVGSPHYLAPEAIHKKRIGPAADCYALGCSLWQCLVGRPPFTGPSDYDVLAAHINDPIPDIALEAEALAPLAPLMRQLLAKRAEKRLADAEAIALQLKELREAIPAQRPAMGWGVKTLTPPTGSLQMEDSAHGSEVASELRIAMASRLAAEQQRIELQRRTRHMQMALVALGLLCGALIGLVLVLALR